MRAAALTCQTQPAVRGVVMRTSLSVSGRSRRSMTMCSRVSERPRLELVLFSPRSAQSVIRRPMAS
jgi:hypothetical protein